MDRTAVNGMRAAPGDILFRIVDRGVVWVMVDVSERDLALLEVGQRPPRACPAYPNRPLRRKGRR